MLKDIVILWIVFQLITIGFAYATIRNQVMDKTLDCGSGEEKIDPFKLAIFPLVIFVPESQKVNNYCENK